MAKSPAANKALATSSQPSVSNTSDALIQRASVTSSIASQESTIFSQGTPVSTQQGLGTPAMPTLTAGGGLRFSNLGGQSRQPLNYSNAQGNDITGLNQALKQDAKSLIEILEP